jgi:hypothetical protein
MRVAHIYNMLKEIDYLIADHEFSLSEILTIYNVFTIMLNWVQKPYKILSFSQHNFIYLLK